MAKKRNTRSAMFKAKIALEAIRERKTISELAKQHAVHSTQIHQWRKQLQDRVEDIFEDGRSRPKPGEVQASTEELNAQIGRRSKHECLPNVGDATKTRGTRSTTQRCVRVQFFTRCVVKTLDAVLPTHGQDGDA